MTEATARSTGDRRRRWLVVLATLLLALASAAAWIVIRTRLAVPVLKLDHGLPWHAVQTVLDLGGVGGLSGLAIDPSGTLWAVCERDPLLFPLSDSQAGLQVAGPPLRIDGMPPKLDGESLARLADGRFAVGTEAKRKRGSDVVLLVDPEGGDARVTEEIELSYLPWHMKAKQNRGIEGLCAVPGQLLAGIENAIEEDDRPRLAPLARYDLTTRAWARHVVRLTTGDGKMSALACRLDAADPSRIEVIAVERHYTVSRILSFDVPISADAPELIEPNVLVDLRRLYEGHQPNFEGIEWLGEDRIALVADSQSGAMFGPTVALVLAPAPAGSALTPARGRSSRTASVALP